MTETCVAIGEVKRGMYGFSLTKCLTCLPNLRKYGS